MSITQQYQTSFFGEGCQIIPDEEVVEEVRAPRIELPLFQKEYSSLLEDGYWPEFMADEENKLVLVFSRVACPTCTACVPSRIPLVSYQLSDTQKQFLDDSHFTADFNDHPDDSEHLTLAQKYYAHRYSNISKDHIADQWNFYKEQYKTRIFEFRDESGKLVGAIPVMFFDGSAVATYYAYDPDLLEKSKKLSFIMIAGLALELKNNNTSDYLYCANWTRSPSRLSPKAKHPIEIREDGVWHKLDKSDARKALTEYYKAFPPELPKPHA